MEVQTQLDLAKFAPEPNKESQSPKKPTYSQNWPAYNQAQTKEKLMFLDLIDGLTDLIKEPKGKRRGRPNQSIKETIISMCLDTYCGKSARKIESDLEIAVKLGYLTKKAHFNTLLNYFKDSRMTELLRKLLMLSSVPLKLVEQSFAVDSSGFSTSTYSRWFDHKWGKEKTYKNWVKAHVMSGVKTKVITSIEITPANVADTTQFITLLQTTHQNFPIQEVVADMAYTSRQNMNAVHQIGGIPFFPFKKNAREHSRGYRIWGRMFRKFMKNREEYMAHYHKRSNAESVFSMIKRELHSHLRTKSFTGQTNEILCIALVHNLTVLVHEIFELGLEVDFCAENEVAQIL